MNHMQNALRRLGQMDEDPTTGYRPEHEHANPGPTTTPHHPGGTGEEGAENPLESRAAELAEAWMNGDREAIQAVRHDSALAVEVFEELCEMGGGIHGPDAQGFAKALRSMSNDFESPGHRGM